MNDPCGSQKPWARYFFSMDPTLIASTLEHPHQFLTKNEELSKKWLKASEWLFNKAIKLQPELSQLDKLYTEGFDTEAIWNQMQLLNETSVEYLQALLPEQMDSSEIEGSDEGQESASIEQDSEQEENYNRDLEQEDVEEQDSEQENEEEQENDDEMDYEQEIDSESESQPAKRKRTPVDDDFFSLEEMEKFAEMGESRDIKMSKVTSMEDESDEEDIFSVGRFMANDGDELEDENANGSLD